jgi:NTE family protein
MMMATGTINTTDYTTIEANNLTQEQWEIAKNTPTNLTPLIKKQTDYLIRHAENMTELQVKLYLP